MPAQRRLRSRFVECAQCSDGQMECSKTRPQCDECRSHRLPCRYGDGLSPKQPRRHSYSRSRKVIPRKSRGSSASDSSSYFSPSPPSTASPPPSESSKKIPPKPAEMNKPNDPVASDAAGAPNAESSLEDQRLFCCWCSSTEQSLTDSKSKDRPWQSIIRRETSKYPALHHTTLALSAMHLASTTQAGTLERNRRIEAAGRHYTQAKEKFPTPPETPSASTSIAAFSTASLLFLYELASSTLAGEESGPLTPSDPGPSPSPSKEQKDALPPSLQKLLDIFQTVRTLLPDPDILDRVENGELKPLFSQGDPYHQLPSTYTLTILSMRNLNSGYAKTDASHEASVYTDAIANLDNSLAMLTKGGDPTTIALRWMFRIPSRYLDLVREKQPLALIILAHYCTVLHHLRDRWWMGDLGIRLVKEISQLLGPDRIDRILWVSDIVGIQS